MKTNVKTNHKCHCGEELHYTDMERKEAVEALIKRFGEFIEVKADGRTWKVQRHYIALHGIKGKDLATLGFEEVVA